MYDISGEQVASRIKKGWQNKCNRFKHMHKLDSELYPYFSDYANVSISRYYQVGLFTHATCSEHTIKSYDPDCPFNRQRHFIPLLQHQH